MNSETTARRSKRPISIPAAAPPKRLSVLDKLSYGVGSTALGVGGIGLSSGLLTFYMNQVIGIPALWVGAALLVTLAVDAVVDPLIGQWSDGTRTRLGRRASLHARLSAPGPGRLPAVLASRRRPRPRGDLRIHDVDAGAAASRHQPL